MKLPANLTLLSVGSNAKTNKSDAFSDQWLTAILHLAHHVESGKEVCPAARLAACAAVCLDTAGNLAFEKNRLVRIMKTLLFHHRRALFMRALAHDITRLVAALHGTGRRLAVRLNGLSDIPWEREPVEHNGCVYDHLMAAFPEVQFYDYTKIWTRTAVPANYHLMFSYSSAHAVFDKHARRWLEAGRNVAVVFRRQARDGKFVSNQIDWPLPASFLGRPVIDGDTHDLRFLDPAPVIVGLRAKGAMLRTPDNRFPVDLDVDGRIVTRSKK